MQPFQIGGGELVQSIWFNLKDLGVKSSGVMSVFIQHVGIIIQDEKLLDSLFEEFYKFIISKDPKLESINNLKSDVKEIFKKSVQDIKQFITTNIPHLFTSENVFSLSFNGSSLLVTTDSKRGVN